QGIESSPALFDPGKVEPRSVGDRLRETRIGDVGIRSWNCRVAPNCERWNSVPESVPKIGIPAPTPVACPPIRMYGKLSQIGETAEGLIRSACLARGQSAKGV